MTTLRWAPLGGNPTPGEPRAFAELAARLSDDASAAGEACSTLRRLATSVDDRVWRGEAADAFLAEMGELPPQLEKLHNSYQRASEALAVYGRVLAGLQEEAESILRQSEASEAEEAAQRRMRDQVEATDPLADTTGYTDAIAEVQTRSVRIRADLDDLRSRRRHAETTVVAALDDAGELGIANESWLQRAWGAVDSWVDDHADLLHDIAGGLAVVAGVAGLLAFIPVLAPIFIPIALVAGGVALALDATLVATGNGDWKSLAIDGVLMAIPGSRLMTAAARGARAAARPARAAAQALRAGAKRVEPGITRALKQVASENGGKMVGLRHRVKSERSLRRKIRREMDVWDTSAEVAAAKIRDVVRFTMRLPDKTLTAQAQDALARLGNDGYGTSRVKNYWVEGNSYKGVNVDMRAPDAHPFELQFHTPESFKLKMGSHKDYEIARDDGLPFEARRQAHDRMVVESGKLEHPVGIENLGELVRIEGPAP